MLFEQGHSEESVERFASDLERLRRLNARANTDYSAVALQLINGLMTPAEYPSSVRDHTPKASFLAVTRQRRRDAGRGKRAWGPEPRHPPRFLGFPAGGRGRGRGD